MTDVYERTLDSPFLLQYSTPKSEKSRAADPHCSMRILIRIQHFRSMLIQNYS
jgi:hypothetical protein